MASSEAKAVETWSAGPATFAAWLRLLAFGAAAGGLVGFLGYLGGDLLICLFNWTGMMVIGAGIAGLLVPPIFRFAHGRGVPMPAAVTLAILLAALPVSLAAAGFGHWVWPHEAARMTLADWYVKTALVEAMVVGLWLLAETRNRRALAVSPILSPLLVNDGVVCLQMEDHYVRVYHASGASLELLSMTEAIARYGIAPGVRAHRSWWVALAAVQGVERDGRNLRIRLEGGLLVPVARNRVASLRTMPEIAALFKDV